MCRSRPSVRNTPAAERRNMSEKTPVGGAVLQIPSILSFNVLILSTCSAFPAYFKTFRMKRRSADDENVQDEARHSSRKRVRSQRPEILGRLYKMRLYHNSFVDKTFAKMKGTSWRLLLPRKVAGPDTIAVGLRLPKAAGSRN
jgi:hypothetical protein